MYIEFKKLVLHNFMSFGDAELCFNKDGFIKVTGVNNNPLDTAGSNGSGKSSLWEGLVWALTGETIRGTKQVCNIYGEDGCFVELELKIDNQHYVILRSKDHKVHKTSLQILLDGQDISGKGIRDSEKILQQYLPDLTASLIGSVIVLGQGLPQKFTNNTPSGRKEVLEQLSKSDFMIEDLKERVASRKSLLSNDIRSFEDALLKINTQKAILSDQISSSEQLLETLDSDELQTRISETKALIQNLNSSLITYKNSLNEVSEKLNGIKQQESSLIIAESNELNSAKVSYDSKTNVSIQKLNENKAQLNIYKSELKRLLSIKDVCPTCGQKIEGVHKPDTREIETNINSIEDNISTLSNFLQEEQIKYEDILKEVCSKYRTSKIELSKQLSEATSNENVTKEEIKKVEDALRTHNSTLLILEKQMSELSTTIELNKKIIQDNKDKLLVMEDEILYNIKQRDIAQSHLEVISKFDTALKRDFRGYLLSTVIEYIQSRALQYAKLIFDTQDMSFCLNGNNIDISYMNKAYENLSGGEKQKIDLIIQFSIRDMLSSQLNFTSNVLVLDEVFDSLDTIGCSKVIDMISTLTDVNNVFIVTHRKDLSIPNDTELIVAKSPVGFSEIRR